MSDNEFNNELKHQLDHCFNALKAFKRTVRERKWNRLADVQEAFETQFATLRTLLDSTDPVDGESDAGIRLRQLELEVRRVQRQLAVEMNDVRENTRTVQSGIRKLQKAKDELQ
ncbi:hypothetical protein MMIC_P0022 [Mariprofundus micogutta]|uniref:Uncharacterized protein n=1 Tax=Mariprofundus micogutta TaxID=1921010 RepID=A0A1L8CJK9_9PROT|nr:hypothetical protein [Mariprofundus micogutta]GAV19093.1 hypothetical protein MMIC_P0022 [Mariprofundus micogutta]